MNSWTQKGGAYINGIRNENAEHLSFESNAFDVIMSNDVFEHVSDVKLAFEEACRVLKKGGELLLSIPFYADREDTRIRAKVEDKKVIFLDEPQYHGNPISNEGSLVFTDFGWDILELMKKSGFSDAYVDIWDGFLCYLRG